MKALVRHLTFAIMLTAAPATSYADVAEIEDNAYGTFGVDTQTDPTNLYAFKFNASGDIFGSSTVRKEGFIDQRLKYGQGNLNLDATVYYNPICTEGVLLSAGWMVTKIDWEENPFFEQKYFHTATAALSFFTGRLEGWFWQTRFALNVSTDDFNFTDYATYDFLLWGRYPLYNWPNAAFHVGFLAQTGMKADQVYPILGIDWQVTPAWKLNMIFPLNISALYTFRDYWTAGVAGRFFSTRNRASESEEPLFFSRAVVEYRSAGIEVLVNYDNRGRISANLHAGYMIAGRMKVSNRHHRHSHWFDIGGTPYVGGELGIKF